MRIVIVYFLLATILFSCQSDQEPLPYLGQRTTVNGEVVHHKIRDWEYYNQDSVKVTNEDLSEYVYVADFFFTSCPSICPKVMKQMLRIHEQYRDNPKVKLVSFTLDPKRDTYKRLSMYAENLEVDTDSWMFLRGDKDFTLDLADDYFVAAFEDASAPGGFDHSGKIILVDKNGHVRSFSEGTDPTETPKMLRDIERLLKEYE